ncbi:MAG TPA: hypothetical protein VIG46_04275 [Candidatus Baltobacteraceae bacterium]|jgi:hypothetical protein
MSAEWVTALAALGTLLVVAGTAIAALVQLRHMRAANQITALMHCRETMEAAETRRTLGFIAHELPKRLADPAELQRIAVFPPVDPDYLAVATLGNLLESIGTLVKRGMIDKDITCDYWAAVISLAWKRTAPITFAARKAIGNDALWENFEYLATVAEDYHARHPSSYPPGARRMPPDTSMIDAMERKT